MFMKTIIKEKNENTSRLAFSGKLEIPVKEGIFYCAVADVIRIESDGSYSTFYVTGGKRYVVSKGLKEYEELLPQKEFFRVHKSHLINMHKIRKYVRNDGNFLEMEDGCQIEVARRKKDEFLGAMNVMGKV
jgi:two-component system LytT family response regulator